MGNALNRNIPSHPKRLPSPSESRLTTAQLTKLLEDLTDEVSQLKEKTTLLYRDQTITHQTNSRVSKEIQELRTGLTTLQNEHCELQRSHALLQEDHRKLQTDQSKLRTDFSKLQDDFTKLQNDRNILHTDYANLQVLLTRFTLFLEAFQAGHSELPEDQNSLELEHHRLRTEISNIRPEQKTHASAVEDVSIEVTPWGQGMTSPSCVASVTDTVESPCTEPHSRQPYLRQPQTGHSSPQEGVTQLHEDLSELEEDTSDPTVCNTNVKTVEIIPQADGGRLHTDMDMVRKDPRSTFLADVARLQMDLMETVLAKQRQLQQSQDTLTSEVDTVKADAEQMKTSLHESLKKASLNITGLEARLDKAGHLFDASGLNKDTCKRGQAMVFKAAKTKPGSGYDDQTGMFTAPHPGLYCFTATVASHAPGNTVFGHIMVGEELQCVVQGGYRGGTGCVMVPLMAGQKAWVQADSPVEMYERYGPYSHFSGTLVLPSL